MIIPTRNRAAQLSLLLEQLDSQQFSKKDYEIIVVDNGSTDATRDTLRTFAWRIPNLRWFTEERIGASFARNAGISQARYNRLIFCDDDTQVLPSHLSMYQAAWKKYPDAGMIGGPVRAENESGRTDSQQRSLIHTHPWCFGHLDMGPSDRLLVQGELLYSANLSILRPTKTVVIFNESLGRSMTPSRMIGAEDYELVTRFILEGKKVWYVPEIAVINAVSPRRFRRRYLLARYFLAGYEMYCMDSFFSQNPRHLSYKQRIGASLPAWRRHGKLAFFREYCRNIYDVITLCAYFLHVYFLGDEKNAK